MWVQVRAAKAFLEPGMPGVRTEKNGGVVEELTAHGEVWQEQRKAVGGERESRGSGQVSLKPRCMC